MVGLPKRPHDPCNFFDVYSEVEILEKLSGDKYYNPRPEFSFKEDAETGLYVCVLILPPNGPFSELVATPESNLLLAKQLVCLEACKKLHIMFQKKKPTYYGTYH
eukprot:c43407_g1_i1 orf=318-632(+)